MWEFPAKSFLVSLSVDGLKWNDAFATDTNVMNVSSVPLGYQYATKAKITMHEVQQYLHDICPSVWCMTVLPKPRSV